MADPLRPAGTKAYLRDSWYWVPTIAGAAPTVAELNGASALNVTKIFFASTARPSQTTNLARAPKRLGDAETYEFVGETQSTIGEARYAFDPQAAEASDGKKAFETFAPGSTGFLVNRKGVQQDVDVAAGQFVTAYPAECGPQMEVNEGDDEGAEVAIAQTFAQTGPKLLNVAVLA